MKRRVVGAGAIVCAVAVACSGSSHPAAPLAAQPPVAQPLVAPRDVAAPVDAGVAPAEPPPLVPPARQQVVVTSSDDCGFILDAVYFESGSAIAPPSAKAVLDETAQMFTCTQQQGEWLKIEIQGHTDDREPEPLTLSDSRAAWVRAQLVARGVPESWLVVQGYASAFPLDRRKTAAARAKNRRVMFLIIARGP